jgi:hypothetical protein
MCEARSRRFDRTRRDTSIGRDYIEGEERVLAISCMTVLLQAWIRGGTILYEESGLSFGLR